MKAVVYRQYGPPEVLHLEEVEKPTPRAGEILVRVRATTVAAGDVRMRKPDPFTARLYNGLFKPKKVNILGFELAGDAEAVGPGVTAYKVGDRVFAFTGFGFGSYAEYRCLPVAGDGKRGLVARMPARLTYEEAAALAVGGITALTFLRKAGVKRGQQVLIYGASGSVGTYAVQLAHYFGAEVTGVCSTANLELVRSLGADRVIDYTAQDFAAGDDKYDIVFDAVGKASKAQCKRVLKAGGRYLSAMGSGDDPTHEDLVFLGERVVAGELKPVIDRCYALEEIVEAHRYVETGRKRGNVVITIQGGDA